jgi:hypothetical protein
MQPFRSFVQKNLAVGGLNPLSVSGNPHSFAAGTGQIFVMGNFEEMFGEFFLCNSSVATV